MKTKLLYFVIIVIMSVSCQNEAVYSCDPEVDVLVKQNLLKIKKMTRNQWLQVKSIELQRGYYAAFTPSQKLSFWEEKLQEVLTLDWSNEEKMHLVGLYNYIVENPGIFDIECNDEIEDEWLKFIYSWQETAKSKFKWTLSTLYGIGLSGERMLDIHGKLAEKTFAQASPRLTPGVEKTCTCSSLQDFCDPTGQFQQRCRTDGAFECNVNPKNCGWFWSFDCDGNCGHLWVN